MIYLRALLLLALLFSTASAEGQMKRTEIDSVLGCLVGQDWIHEDLKELGLKQGDTATVRYGLGAIPGTSPANPESVNIVVYSPDSRRAWLLLARRERGDVVALRNAYRLTRTHSGWTASEGNGGLATYKAVARYVTSLSKRTALKLRLTVGGGSCRAED